MRMVIRMMAIAMFPVALLSSARRMKKNWNIGVKSQARRLNGSAWSGAGARAMAAGGSVATGVGEGVTPGARDSAGSRDAGGHDHHDQQEQDRGAEATEPLQ